MTEPLYTVFTDGGGVVVEDVPLPVAADYLTNARLARGWSACGCVLIRSTEELSAALATDQSGSQSDHSRDLPVSRADGRGYGHLAGDKPAPARHEERAMSRELLQQALDALEIGREAAQEVADRFHAEMAGYKQRRHDALDADVQNIDRAIDALRAALAAPQGEPVAWQWLDSGHFRKKLPYGANSGEWIPLYTASPPAAPSVPASHLQPVGDLRAAKWLDPECADAGACQSLRFKAPSAPVGWKLVPVEPTEEMLRMARACFTARNLYRAMVAAAPEAPSVPAWVACSERVPDADIDVLAFIGPEMYIANYEPDGWYDARTFAPLDGITHWMDLPEAPSDKEADK